MATVYSLDCSTLDDVTAVEIEGTVSSDGTSIIVSRYGIAANGWDENGFYTNDSFDLESNYVFYWRLIFENDGSGDTSPEAMFGWRTNQSIAISSGTRHGFYFQASRADGWQITSDTNQQVTNINGPGVGEYDFKGEIDSGTGFLTLYIRNADNPGGPIDPDSGSWTVAGQHNFDYRSSSGWYWWANNFDAHNRVKVEEVYVTDDGSISAGSGGSIDLSSGSSNIRYRRGK